MSDDLDATVPLPTGNGRAGSTAGGPPKPPSEHPDLVGRQLGDFRVLRRLGAGGMAEVFLAEQVSLKRPVALKVLRAEMTKGDETQLQRFAREAKAAANLNHANIVQVFAVGEQDGIHYIAQEYVPGQTLREWLRRNGPPEPLVAIKLIRQIAAALDAAAEAGVVHRDIKPENVLLNKKGEAKVADFGLAQLSQAGERVALTQVGLTMGTPLYMSPEQVAGKPVDHRSDLYSLGVTAYHLLAGAPPFRGETALSVAVQHLNAAPEPLEKVRRDLPPALSQIVAKLMEKEPARRYQTAADLAADLRNLAANLRNAPDAAGKAKLESFTVAKPQPAVAASGAVPRLVAWGSRRQLTALALASVAVALVGAGAGWLTRPADPLSTPAPPPPVKRAGSAWEQYWAARIADSPAAWQAVRTYWANDPAAPMVLPRANVRLGLLRLEHGELDDAAFRFDELAQESDDPYSAVNGLAGQAVVASLRGDTDRFRRIVGEQLFPLGRETIGKELDETLARYFYSEYGRNREAVAEHARKEFDELRIRADAEETHPEAR